MVNALNWCMKFFRLLLIVCVGLIAMSMRNDAGDVLSFFGVVTDEYTNAPLVGAKVSYVAENGESLTMKVAKWQELQK